MSVVTGISSSKNTFQDMLTGLDISDIGDALSLLLDCVLIISDLISNSNLATVTHMSEHRGIVKILGKHTKINNEKVS